MDKLVVCNLLLLFYLLSNITFFQQFEITVCRILLLPCYFTLQLVYYNIYYLKLFIDVEIFNNIVAVLDYRSCSTNNHLQFTMFAFLICSVD